MTSETPLPQFDSKAFLATLTCRPGVYRMLGKKGELLYVGKAKNLKRRVGSYFRRSHGVRIQRMVSQIEGIEVTVTHTEAEALILENTLIKSLRPRYNILLRDDKSYPYIHLSADQPFPRLSWHRGARTGGGRYFGPYPNSGSMRENLQLLQKLFPVRQCEDGFFRNRSRPCLQYQIKRCTAPCVGLVSEEEYRRDVQDAVLFLEGRAGQVIDNLVGRMEQAASQLAFEQAARYRDQIAALRRIQEKQYVSGERGDLDILAAAVKGGVACLQLFFIRSGRNLGNKVFFPKIPEGAGERAVLSAFMAQYYIGKEPPPRVIVSAMPADARLLAEVLAKQAGRRIHITDRVRGERLRWLEMARQNARLALDARLASGADLRMRRAALQQALGLDELPARVECFDISHTGGEQTVASCVVFDARGALRSDYRRFNIKDVAPGDDYAAMRQALSRHYRRIQAEEGCLPDLLLIDGGKGQLAVAAAVLEELGVLGITLVGVAKGAERKPGRERLFLFGRRAPIILSSNSPALHLIQQIRDEAHRFAIAGHRQRRGRSRTTSVLEEIAGIGSKRRQRLLRQFGGLQELARAGVDDLSRVEGIGRRLAQQIYEAFHGDE